MRKKKIAILCNYQLLPHRIGGMDNFFWAFDAKCKKEGIQVDWFFPNFEFIEGYEKFILHSANHKPLEIFFLEYCQDTKFDLIITHFLELCTPFYKKLKKLSPCPIIAVDHNPRPIGGYPFKKKIEKKVKSFLYAKYIDTFVAVSEATEQELYKDFGQKLKNKTKVIFNGIDFAQFQEKKEFHFTGKFIVASHLRKEKGIQDLITAVNELKKEQEITFHIDLYGIGNYQKKLKQMIEEFELQSYFNFKGNVNNLKEIYPQYDYLIHPSHGETFCYTVVESIMSNLPVITTHLQGNVLGLVQENKNGFLFYPQDTVALKEILKKIVQQSIQLHPTINKNKMLIYSLDTMVKNYLELLQ